ncbi:proline-rich protein 29-like [Mobula birostris]|uniref:proline-rich protein 29-like n=1 Tax=Mobula birostris TaxID=1983395 RepID=UPI003B28838F
MYFSENDVYFSPDWEQKPQTVQIIQQQVPQHPATIIQQLPAPQQPQIPLDRNGHMKEELVELMMIQNAQMHQVIMNNITMAALSSFGYNTQSQSAKQNPVSIRMEQSEPDTVYHHHYELWQCPSYPSWPTLPPQMYHTRRLQQENWEPAVRHISRDGPLNPQREFQSVPPPPPPSATGTVGADVLPASEYYDMADGQI